METDDSSGFPILAGVLLGLGLGGFFDGIVLHQVLQWHHMLTSAGYPPTSVDNLEINTLWDGLFHATTYLFVVLGLVLLWRASRRTHIRRSSKLLLGSLLIGFGIFNLVEGIVDHHLLGIHHVNGTVPREQWLYWDLAFLVWGAAMLVGAGSCSGRDGTRRETEPHGMAPCRSRSAFAETDPAWPGNDRLAGAPSARPALAPIGWLRPGAVVGRARLRSRRSRAEQARVRARRGPAFRPRPGALRS